ncbi:MAG: carbohydrate-binding family 9-like protein [Oscillospiraceae bacterium]
MYKIKAINDISEIEKGNVAKINVYNWNCEYQPVAFAKMCYIKDQGFAVLLSCEEKNPLATYTKPNCMVCEDSCLEVFANFKPTMEDKGYINFEANANGSLLCEYGKAGGNRQKLVEMGLYNPKISVSKTKNDWGYTLFIPLDLIEKVYGNAEFKSGDKIKANFFKCGDKTKSPHYGSYTKIDWECPSFHRPQFFSDMMIE